MKSAANIFLTLLTIPLIFICLLVSIVRFQLLSPPFWQAVFEKNNIYPKLAIVIRDGMENQIIKDGGKVKDAKILTNLITSENLEDFVTRNLDDILGYINGKYPTLNIYIPIAKIPKGLLTKNITSQPDQIYAETLIKEFNISFINSRQLQSLSVLGKTVTYLLILSWVITLLFILFLYLLVKSGGRFITLGIVSLVSGLLSISTYTGVVETGKIVASDLLQKTTTAEIIAGTLIPPLLQEILNTILIMGIILTAIGVVLFFVRKPYSSV